MGIKQLSKKAYIKKKEAPDQTHWEGDYFCDCRTRNIRKWLAKKKYGSSCLDSDEWILQKIL